MNTNKFSKAIGTAENTGIVFCLVVMTIITFGNVLSRKLLHMSWSFVDEITTNMLVWVVFLGGAIAARRGAHVGLTLLTDAFPKKVKKIVSVFGTIVCVAFFALIAYQGVGMLVSQMNLGQTTPALGWPQWMMSMSVPIGSVLLMYRFAEAGYYNLKNFNAKKENSEEENR